MDPISRLEAGARMQRTLDAERLRTLAEAVAATQVGDDVGRDGVGGGSGALRYRSLRAEVATALRVSEHRVESEMSLAYSLFGRYPQTVAMLEQGEIDLQHARVIVDAGHVLDCDPDDPVAEQHRAEYEQAVLEFAIRETPNRLRPIARRLAEQWAFEPIEIRHIEAMKGRSVTVVNLEDGMADLIARIPAIEAYAIKDRLGRAARAVERKRGEDKAAGKHGSACAGEQADASSDASAEPVVSQTRDEIRADILCDLLLRSSVSESSGIDANIQLIVPVEALSAGRASEGDWQGVGGRTTCELAGYGPVSRDSALDLAAEAPGWDRVKVHPTTSQVLSVDRYRPSQEMRRMLAVRDRYCAFPGCRVPANRCDIDHTIDAAHGGPTSTDNLAHLCRGHHTLKHQTDWKVTQCAGGVLEWRSPSGRIHRNYPPEALPERRPRKPVRFEAHPF